MRLTIQYFAEMAEVACCSEEFIETTQHDLSSIYAELKARHGFRFPQSALKPARNDVMVSWDHPVQQGDVLAFLPPFSGG